MGYKNHSEIGWVLREYNRLINDAQKLGIESPESYYDDGKIKGKTNRDKGIGESSEKKTSGNISDSSVGARTSEATLTDEIDEDSHLEKFSFNDLPNLVEKISMIEIPRLLYGLKILRRK